MKDANQSHRTIYARNTHQANRFRSLSISLASCFLALTVVPVLSETTDGPKAVISGTVADLGALPRGKPVVRQFQIENTGTTPLEISARANCGCTVANYDRRIPPGGKGKFTVDLKTKDLLGEFRKTVDVTTNDSTLPNFVLELRGESIPAVKISPDPNLPVEAKWAESTEKEFVVKTANGVTLIDAVTTDAALKPRIELVETNTYKLTFRFPPEIPAGSNARSITLKTDAEFESSIPMQLRLEKGLIASPPSLKLLSAFGQPQAGSKGAVIVRSASGPVRIVKASSSDENLNVEAKSVTEGKIYQVIVTEKRRQPGPKEKNFSPRTIVLETDDPHQTRFEIPVR
ncbi:DUF1573 domain-containing protein [bacterium]|nr:DUF1573 domain-containing protein [bacterium]